MTKINFMKVKEDVVQKNNSDKEVEEKHTVLGWHACSAHWVELQ